MGWSASPKETVAEEVAAGPIGPMVAQTYLRELQQTLSKYSSDELRKITDNIVPASTKAAIQNLLYNASDVSRLVSLPVLEMVRAQIATGANLSSDALRQELRKAASASVKAKPTHQRTTKEHVD